MTDVDPRSTASRTLRASVGLTALAAALLICGAAVEATANLHGSPANGSSSPHPTPTVHPTQTRSHAPEAPSPDRPPPTSPAYLPRPTTTATATGSSLNGR